MRSIDEQEPLRNRSRENRTNALVSGARRHVGRRPEKRLTFTRLGGCSPQPQNTSSYGSARYADVEQEAAPTDTLICSPGDT
jgi:hypothetical protein